MKTVELAPMSFGLLCQLEHHHQRRHAGAAAFRLTGPMPHRRERRLDRIRRPQMNPVLGREVVERQQHVPVLRQAFDRVRVLRKIFRKESAVGDECLLFRRRQIHLMHRLFGVRLNALEQLVQFLGSSSVVVYFIIKKAHTAEAVNAVHNEFFGFKSDISKVDSKISSWPRSPA